MRSSTGEPSVRCFQGSTAGVHATTRELAADAVRDALASHEIAAGSSVTWIDITCPAEAEGQFLHEELGLHPLAIEDSLKGRQRPKLDRYPGYLFLVFYAARINLERNRVALNEVHLFLGHSFLVTVHAADVPEVGQVAAAWRRSPERLHESGAIAHALLDSLTDNYFPVAEHFGDRLEELEDRIFDGDGTPSMQDAIMLRNEMILFRRILTPERDVLSSLVRHDLLVLRPELVPYFQDVYDHLMRVTEEIDAFRDLLTGLMEVQASHASNRLNATMQTLTAWSIILMSMTVIAGVYGMNFAHMPELELRWGYFGALGAMGVIGAMLAMFFSRKGWI
jgi:magnesium transporter